MARRLTPRQLKAAAEYVANGGNGRQALLAAGYSESTGHNSFKVLRREGVAKHVSSLIKKETDKAPGVVARFERLVRKFSRAIESNVEEAQLQDPILAGQLLKLMLDGHEKALSIKEKYKIDDVDTDRAIAAYEQRKSQAVHVGRLLAWRSARQLLAGAPPRVRHAMRSAILGSAAAAETAGMRATVNNDA